jgi:hypothetical protein
MPLERVFLFPAEDTLTALGIPVPCDSGRSLSQKRKDRKAARKAYADSGKPMVCPCGNTEGVTIHHVINLSRLPATLDRQVVNQLGNLCPLCQDCHSLLHNNSLEFVRKLENTAWLVATTLGNSWNLTNFLSESGLTPSDLITQAVEFGKSEPVRRRRVPIGISYLPRAISQDGYYLVPQDGQFRKAFR